MVAPTNPPYALSALYLLTWRSICLHGGKESVLLRLFCPGSSAALRFPGSRAVVASRGAGHIVSRSGVVYLLLFSVSVRYLEHRLVVPSFLFVAFSVCSLSSPKMMTKSTIDGSSHVLGWQPASSRACANGAATLLKLPSTSLRPAANVTQHLKAQVVSRQLSRQQVRKIKFVASCVLEKFLFSCFCVAGACVSIFQQ